MNNELNITGIKHGLLAGVISMLVSGLCILVSREAYMGIAGIASWIVFFAVLIVLGRKERNQKYDGQLTYLAAFVYSSIVFFIAGYLLSATQITIINYVDPEIQNILLNEGMKNSEKIFRFSGMDEVELDRSLGEVERSIKMGSSYYSLIYNSWGVLVQAMILGAIGALFIKKKKPDFVEKYES